MGQAVKTVSYVVLFSFKTIYMPGILQLLGRIPAFGARRAFYPTIPRLSPFFPSTNDTRRRRVFISKFNPTAITDLVTWILSVFAPWRLTLQEATDSTVQTTLIIGH